MYVCFMVIINNCVHACEYLRQFFIEVLMYNIGLCTDGEFNSMRNNGYTRPLSVLKIRSDV